MLRIQEAREAHGWTQEQLANALGTTQQTVQRWEAEIVEPKLSKLMEISHVLGVTLSYLMDINPQDADDDDIELLNLFHKMTDSQQAALLAVAYAIVDGR